MRIRNKTGVPQGLDGYTLTPGRWYHAPEQIPLSVVTRAWQIDAIEWEFDEEKFEDGILWTGLFSHGSGYGTANENLMLAMQRSGANLDVQPLFPVKDNHIRFGGEMKYHKVGCCFAVPDFFDRLITPVRVGFTMCESTDPLGKRPEWRHLCDAADRIVVPSQFCKDVFSKFYKRQIDVVGLPLHDDFFHPRLRETKETFTFVTYGVLAARKSPLETIDLFKKTFPSREYPDVRLEIKTRIGLLGMAENQIMSTGDYRIKIINEDWTRQRLIDWLYKADCMLFLTKGEGYGMPPREALCMGTPVIATETSGLKDLAKYVYPVPVLKREPALIGGEWDVPDWDKAGDWMMSAYLNRENAYEYAFNCANDYIRDYAPSKLAEQLIEILEESEPSSRTKRRPQEQANLCTILKHKPLYDLVEGKVVWDVGVGDGVAYVALSKMGKDVYGIVNPGDKARVEELLRKRGVEPRIKEYSLVNIDKDLWPKPDTIISQGFFQNISPREANMILSACYRICNNVVFSVPTVYYPGYFKEGAKFMRRPAWEDYLSSVAVECRYYGKNDRYMRGKVVGKSAGNRPQGRRNGDTWRPVDNTGR